MASKSPEEKVEFLLKFLATCEEIKPDYHKLQVALGINTQSNAQRQFKAIVQAGKQYVLESSRGSMRVIDNTHRSLAVAKPNKGRKRTKNETDDSDEEEKPTTKAKKSKASKKEVVNPENADEDADDE